MRTHATMYRLFRTDDGCSIHRETRPTRGMFPVDPRLDLWNHSPTSVEWGYSGSGPAQTALAILADFTGDDELARRLHQRFKRDVISGLDRSEPMIEIEGLEIEAWLSKQVEASHLFRLPS